jgi:hypothetical protein
MMLWRVLRPVLLAPFCCRFGWKEVNDMQKWGVYRRTFLMLGSLSMLATILSAGIKWR